jgi:RND family efflux transporter MFP subunit
MKIKFMFLNVGLALILNSCSSDKDNAEQQGKFLVTSPIVIDTTYTNDYVASIQSVYYVELRSRVKGFIENINTDEGKEVKKGQILFSISNEDYKEELLKAKANMKVLTADLKAQQLETQNLKLLVDKNVVSKTELEIAQTKVDVINAKIEEAESNIAEAEINLSRTEIKSPFDGVIDLIPNKTGNLIEEGALLSTVTNNKAVFAYFNVSEREYLDFFSKTSVTDSESVSLILVNNQVHKFKGVIEAINGKIEKNTGSLTIRAHFPNPELLIKHGSSAKVRVYIPLKKALIIPQKSTIEIQEKNYVFILDKDNVVKMKSFVPKLRLSNFYVVESGLTASDKIIYEGIQLVKEGDKIIPQIISAKEVLNNQVK